MNTPINKKKKPYIGPMYNPPKGKIELYKAPKYHIGDLVLIDNINDSKDPTVMAIYETKIIGVNGIYHLKKPTMSRTYDNQMNPTDTYYNYPTWFYSIIDPNTGKEENLCEDDFISPDKQYHD